MHFDWWFCDGAMLHIGWWKLLGMLMIHGCGPIYVLQEMRFMYTRFQKQKFHKIREH